MDRPGLASALLAAGLTVLALGWIQPAPAGPPASPPRPALLLGDAYPIETRVEFHAALLHWMDSLAELTGAGMTAGKTVDAHRLDFDDRVGPPSETDIRALRRYAEMRSRFAERNRESPDSLAVAFFEAPTLDAALRRAGELLDEASLDDLRAAIEHFSPGYRSVWRKGRIPNRFLSRAARTPQRGALGEFLRDLVGFYGVADTARPRPHLILTPVRSGYGTHAQALGRHLLIEVREGESLTDQIGPIVHENAHFLFRAIDPSRREALRSLAAELSTHGFEAWRVLEEALPTALAQGVAEERFSPGWRAEDSWYHVESVDRYAKSIFPLVKAALAEKRTFDEPLVSELIEAYRP